MALIAMQDVSTSGATLTYTACAGGGDTVPYDPTGFIHVKNGSGSPITVTVDVPGTYLGQAITDVAVSVPATGDKLIKMAAGMIQPTTGVLNLTYSGVTSLTLAALRAPPQ